MYYSCSITNPCLKSYFADFNLDIPMSNHLSKNYAHGNCPLAITLNFSSNHSKKFYKSGSSFIIIPNGITEFSPIFRMRELSPSQAIIR